MSTEKAGTFGAFRIPNFRILFVGTLCSFTAFFMSTIVQSVVAFELTGLNGAVGTAVFGQGLGMMLIGPLGGAYADRLPKKLVIAIGQCISALSLATMGFLYADGAVTIPFLAANSFVMGSTFGFIGPARQALVVDLVPDSLRGNAMTLTNVSNTTSRLLGPAAAGTLLGIEAFGAGVAYWTMAAFYVLSAVLLIALPASVVREEAGETHVLQDLREGLVYAWNHRQLRNMLLFFVTVMLIGFPHTVLIPGWLEHELGRPKEQVAIVAFFSAVGAFSASLFLARYADSSKATRIYSYMAIGFGVTLLGFAAAPDFYTGIFAMVLVGATSGGFHALNGAVTSRVTETRYMGRVMSLNFMAFAGFSLTALPVGQAADAFGVRTVLGWMGAAVLLLSVAMTIVVARDSRKAGER